MTTDTTIKTKFNDREIAVRWYSGNRDALLSIVNLRSEQAEIAWLDEDAARHLVVTLVSHFGNGIIKPKVKTFAEQYAELPNDSYFTINGPSGNVIWMAWKRPDGKLVSTGLGWHQLAKYGGFDHGIEVNPGAFPDKVIVVSDWRPPKPKTLGEQVQDLAVGDQFTTHYASTGLVTKGVKISADEYFSYSQNATYPIAALTRYAGTVTKEN